MGLIDETMVRAQALNAARERNAVLIYIPEEHRKDMASVGKGEYASLPTEFFEAFLLMDRMVEEGLFTRTPFPDAGILYTITEKGREEPCSTRSC